MSVFSHSDYKKAVKEILEGRPNKGRGELSRLARHLGVNATMVSQVLSGSKDFTHEQAFAVCEFLGLVGIETEYFMLLVQKARAGTQALQRFYTLKISRLRDEALVLSERMNVDRKLNEQERAVFYSSWIFSAVRVFTSLSGRGKTTHEIAERFDLPIGKVSEIMNFLVGTGLCLEEKGRFKMGPQQTHLEWGSPHLSQHLRNWHMSAMQNVERLSKDELMFSACLSISREDFAEVREMLAAKIKSVAEKVKSSSADEVACFNLDWFWVRK
jgi:uncharacterized protein (TIGR02147 family)